MIKIGRDIRGFIKVSQDIATGVPVGAIAPDPIGAPNAGSAFSWASGIGRTLYIGNKLQGISDEVGAGGDLMRAAYNVERSGSTIDDSISDAEAKRNVSGIIGGIAAYLSVATKAPLSYTLPIAAASIGAAYHYDDEADTLKKLKGQKLMMHKLENI